MDVRTIITVAVVLTVCGRISAQNSQVDPSTNINSTSGNEPAKECLTAKNVSGVCVQRNSCDYSTGAIDLTLYASHDYQRPCAMAEVCCPQSAIVHVEASSPETLDFDDDDD